MASEPSQTAQTIAAASIRSARERVRTREDVKEIAPVQLPADTRGQARKRNWRMHS